MLSLLSLVPLCRVYRKSHPKAVFSALSLFDIFNFYFAFALWSIFLPCRKLNEARSSQLSALSLRSYRCPTAVADGRNNRGTDGQSDRQRDNVTSSKRDASGKQVSCLNQQILLCCWSSWTGVEWNDDVDLNNWANHHGFFHKMIMVGKLQQTGQYACVSTACLAPYAPYGHSNCSLPLNARLLLPPFPVTPPSLSLSVCQPV